MLREGSGRGQDEYKGRVRQVLRVREGSGWVREGSGWVRKGSKWIREGSGRSQGGA